MLARSYTNALEDALGRVVADFRREAELHRARSAETIADLRFQLVEANARLAALEAASEQRIAARLADIRDGQDGADGTPGERGDKGEPGERGEKGDPGERGPQGEKGDPGEHGANGSPGERGPVGERGEKGDPGERGERGEPGPEGAKGERGDPGERGPEGAPGKLPLVRAWAEGVYYESDVVSHRGATWQAARDTGREPPHADWIELAARGADGRGFTVRGTFNADETYSAHDVVMLGGSSFVAKTSDPGACPGDGWQLFSSRGSRGAAGDKGERGERGEKGAKGERGASPVAMIVDEDDAALTLVLDDGVEIRADLYPLLTRMVR